MNKKALITGASRGIGKSIATAFASAGYDLYLTCLQQEDRLHCVKKELETNYHISCQTFLCDMGDFDAVSNLFKSIPTLDVLVNNAGISYVGLLSDMSPFEWHQIMNTNLNACFYTCKLAVPMMVHQKQGRIINISSVWGNVGASTEVAYSTTKGGMNSFTKALAKELAPSNIQVNAIACGVIDTEMNQCFTEEDLLLLKDEIPANRFGTTDEIADFALQLSSAPTYLTGQIITIDGGFL